jgi:hypothetical protein
MLHVTSSHLNPIFKEPPPPPLKKQFIRKKKKRKKNSTLYLKIPLERGGKKSSPSFSLFLNFHLITLPHPHFTLLDPT